MRRNPKARFWFAVITSPLSFFALFLIILYIVRAAALLLGLGLPVDPSGRLALFGQPLIVWMPLLFPLYLILLVVRLKTRKTPSLSDS